MEPSFFLSYWRPWKEDSSLIDSWGNYLRDTSLVDYGAEKIGGYIKEASRDTIRAIENASYFQVEATQQAAEKQASAVMKAADLIRIQLNQIGAEVGGVNRRLDLVLEQQRAGNMLRQDIAELLRIPDYEKERIHAINLGIQFFNKAAKDPDLLHDALEEFLHAESLKKQDYFVLHRIGCIYLYSEDLMDLEKARDYFIRAAKYAVIESEDDAKPLVSELISSSDPEYLHIQNDQSSVGLLAADSYDKVALIEYILGNDEAAIHYQKKAVQYYNSPRNNLILAKYLMRAGDKDRGAHYLEEAVKQNPLVIEDALSDLDLAVQPFTLNLVDRIDAGINDELERIASSSVNSISEINDNSSFKAVFINKVIEKIKDRPLTLSLRERCSLLEEYHKTSDLKDEEISILNEEFEYLSTAITSYPIFSLNSDEITNLLKLVSISESSSPIDLHNRCEQAKSILKNSIAKPGDYVYGGRITKLALTDGYWCGEMFTDLPGKYEVEDQCDLSRICRTCNKGGWSDWVAPSSNSLLSFFELNDTNFFKNNNLLSTTFVTCDLSVESFEDLTILAGTFVEIDDIGKCSIINMVSGDPYVWLWPMRSFRIPFAL